MLTFGDSSPWSLTRILSFLFPHFSLTQQKIKSRAVSHSLDKHKSIPSKLVTTGWRRQAIVPSMSFMPYKVDLRRPGPWRPMTSEQVPALQTAVQYSTVVHLLVAIYLHVQYGVQNIHTSITTSVQKCILLPVAKISFSYLLYYSTALWLEALSFLLITLSLERSILVGRLRRGASNSGHLNNSLT